MYKFQFKQSVPQAGDTCVFYSIGAEKKAKWLANRTLTAEKTVRALEFLSEKPKYIAFALKRGSSVYAKSAVIPVSKLASRRENAFMVLEGYRQVLDSKQLTNWLPEVPMEVDSKTTLKSIGVALKSDFARITGEIKTMIEVVGVPLPITFEFRHDIVIGAADFHPAQFDPSQSPGSLGQELELRTEELDISGNIIAGWAKNKIQELLEVEMTSALNAAYEEAAAELTGAYFRDLSVLATSVVHKRGSLEVYFNLCYRES
jgi:hypothetical protein